MEPAALDTAFSPLQIGPLTLRNRVTKSATNEGMTPNGVPSRALAGFHERIAAGGAAPRRHTVSRPRACEACGQAAPDSVVAAVVAATAAAVQPASRARASAARFPSPNPWCPWRCTISKKISPGRRLTKV